MIELITGLPGNCKTLYSINLLRKWAKDESRQVFYHGVPLTDLGIDTLGWLPLEDATKWYEVPPNSIVVIDECQKIFRNRSLGATPPKHVTELETHRHLGIDLLFITQHPSLVDPAIRKLTGRHRHMVRIFGMEVSTVHRWDSVRDNCDKTAGRKDSDKEKWKFDKSIYPLYKSAEVHTMKRSLPMRLKLLMLAPLLLAGAGYFLYTKLSPKVPATAPQVASTAVLPAAGGPVPGGPVPGVPAGPVPFDALADAKQYVAMATPRIEGLPHTSPKYDKLTEPTAVPVPAMCIQHGEGGSKCECKTQQSTPMDVSHSMCVEFARNGFFQDFNANRDRVASERSNESSRVLDSRLAAQ